MAASPVDALMQEYTRRYVAHDEDGVTELCICPFLAIREGVAIHLADRAAVRNHFATSWMRIEMPATRVSHRSRSTPVSLVSGPRSRPCAGTRWTPKGTSHATR